MKLNLLFVSLIILSSSFCKAQNKEISQNIPEGYVLFSEYYGDLNNDGLEDCVLVVKDTRNVNIVTNKYNDDVDRNRRGIIILLNKEFVYEVIVENLDCFSSENENGGVYFPPQLSFNISNQKLEIHYSHGRYGYWKYIFKYDKSDFNLIGYESSANSGPVVNYKTSINFLTQKKLISENTNENLEGEVEVFKESWSTINLDRPIKLSEIKDFQELDMSMF